MLVIIPISVKVVILLEGLGLLLHVWDVIQRPQNVKLFSKCPKLCRCGRAAILVHSGGKIPLGLELEKIAETCIAISVNLMTNTKLSIIPACTANFLLS